MNMLSAIGADSAESMYSIMVQGEIVTDDDVARYFTENALDPTDAEAEAEAEAEALMKGFLTRMKQYQYAGDVYIVMDQDNHPIGYIHLDEDLKHAIASDPTNFKAKMLQQVLDKKREAILSK